MALSHLDMEELRRPHEPVERTSADPAGLQVTRRTFLGLTAGAAIPVVMRADADHGIRFVRHGAGAMFLLNGAPGWSIDPRRFDGTPRLQVRESRSRVELIFTDARYPGSLVPADFRAVCHDGGAGWSIDIAFTFAGFHAIGPMEPWLRGDALLVARGGGWRNLIPNGVRLSLDETSMSFRRDWTFAAETPAGQLVVDGVALAASAMAIGFDERAPVFKDAARFRTAIDVARGAHEWESLSLLPRVPSGALSMRSEGFDAFRITLDARRAALEAHAAAPLSYEPGPAFRSSAGAAAALALRDVRYAAVFAADGSDERALIGSFATRSSFALDGVVLQVGGSSDPSFEVVTNDGEVSHFRAAPAFIAALAPLSGGSTLPIEPVSPTPIDLTSPSTAMPHACSAGELGSVCLPNCCIPVLRAADMLNLCFELRNLAIQKKALKPLQLVRCDNAKPALLIVHFPPQAVGERAYLEASGQGNETPDPPPVAARLAGSSRLAFELPDDFTGAPFSLDTLLAWSGLTAMTVGLTRKRAAITNPESGQTAIELPYRLIIEPERNDWIVSGTPVSRSGRTELWHALLGTTGGSTPLRAVWSPDFAPSGGAPPRDNVPFRMALSKYDRHSLVRLTHDEATGPAAAPARVFALSSLGAWADIEALWPDSVARRAEGLDLEKWVHQITMGRDQHAIVAYSGFLYPFGHKVALFKETTREILDDPQKHPVAWLRQKYYIVIKQPDNSYDLPDNPYVKLTITDPQTPVLDPIPNETLFWPTVNKKEFLFSFVGTDRAGNNTKFTAPAVFVSTLVDPALAAALYNAGGKLQRTDLQGQIVALALPVKHGDTEVEGHELDFEGVPRVPPDPLDATFQPRVKQIHARLAALDAMVGGDGGSAWLELVNPETNATHVFAQVKTNAETPDKFNASFAGKADRSGGIVAPAVTVTHLSRLFGPVGATSTAAAGGGPASFDLSPTSFFPDAAQILGGLKLRDIISLLPIDVPEKVPALLTSREEWTDLPDRITQRLDWSTDHLRDVPGSPLSFRSASGKTAHLELKAFLELILDSQVRASATSSGALRDFVIGIDIGGLAGIEITFESFTFHAASGAGTSCDVKVAGVAFTGALKFVQELSKKIGFDKLQIDLEPDAVNIAVPPIVVPTINAGAFGLENLTITNSCRIPFTGEPITFQFDFARRDRPFLLTIGQFSGGGFVGIGVDTKVGVRSLGAAFEFGAMKEIDFGVAHGRLFVMGGLYYSAVFGGGSSVEFYVRAGGVVQALGIISVSVDLYVALRYLIRENVFEGSATLTYGFEIGFVKKSFSITYSQRFGGGGGGGAGPMMMRHPGDPVVLSLAAGLLDDATPPPPPANKPAFGDYMPLDAWRQYWAAFA